MTRLAQIISHNEGFGIPNATPTTHNNPGDLRHSPHSLHPTDPNGIGVIDTPEHGWEDLERQLEIYAKRGMTLKELAYTYAPPADNNNTVAYLNSICTGLSLPETALVSTALLIGAN
jgi:hypothetical protein